MWQNYAMHKASAVTRTDQENHGKTTGYVMLVAAPSARHTNKHA